MAREIGKIIVPVDGSEEAKKAAKKAIYIAKYLKQSITALYVIDASLTINYGIGSDMLSPDFSMLLRKEAEIVLNEVAKMGKRNGVRVIKKIVEGIPSEEIIKFANKNDLIVMGSRGRSAIERILIGSVSEKVLHHAPCSVMIVR
ncbi:MAG: universal stress protein [Thermoplasmata archaeon]|nr:universal stress protein [Thermoplasmata archaeon]